jgi:hypothetical protein
MSVTLKRNLDFEILSSVNVKNIVQNLDDLKECPICYVKVYLDKVNTYVCSENGHECCQTCYSKNPEKSKCPTCRQHGMIKLPQRQLQELSDSERSKTQVCCPVSLQSSVEEYKTSTIYFHHENEVAVLPVRVENQYKCCSWKGKLEDLDSHLQSCQHLLVACPYCQREDQLVNIFHMNKEFDKHLKQCSSRPVSCTLCSTIIPYSKKDFHQEKCPMRVIDCVFGCGTSLPLNSLDNHLLNECLDFPIKCPWKNKLGCTVTCVRRDMEAHLKEIDLHLCLSALTSCLECNETFSVEVIQEHSRCCGRKKCSNDGCDFQDFDHGKIYFHKRTSCMFERFECVNEGCNLSIMRKDSENHHSTCLRDPERLFSLLKRSRDEHEITKSQANKYRRMIYETDYTRYEDDEEEEEDYEEDDSSETIGSNDSESSGSGNSV